MSFDPDLSDPLVAEALTLRDAFGRTLAEPGQAGGRTSEHLKALKESSLPSAAIPRSFGGKGAPWLSVLRIVREFARTDASLAHDYGYHHLPLNAVLAHGSAAQQQDLLTRSATENWLWGNSDSAASGTSTAKRNGKGWILNGQRPFSSASHAADYLQIDWENGDGRLTAAVPVDRAGIGIEDNRDGIGQTQSNEITFNDVHIADDELIGSSEGSPTPFQTLTPLLEQAVLLNILVGSAQGALSEGRDYTVSQSRPWVYSGYEKHTDDPFVQRKYGDLVIRTFAATELADNAARRLDAAVAKGVSLTDAERGNLAIELATADLYAGEIGLAASSGIFEVLGARSATKANGYDRFWRNVRARTINSPAENKKRAIGAWLLTGKFPTGGPDR